MQQKLRLLHRTRVDFTVVNYHRDSRLYIVSEDGW